MIGVSRRINPLLGDAGDGVGRADVSSLQRLCADNPDVRFLGTLLSRRTNTSCALSPESSRTSHRLAAGGS